MTWELQYNPWKSLLSPPLTCIPICEPLWNTLRQNTGHTNWESKLHDKGFNKYICWKKCSHLMVSFEFRALVHGEVCCESSVCFSKGEPQAKKMLPVLRRKLRCIPKLHTYSETSPETSLAKLRQQKFTNKIPPALCIWRINMLPLWALTITNVHGHRYELGNNSKTWK